MNVLRYLAILSFVAGVSLLAYGFVRSDNSNTQAASPLQEFDAVATATSSPTDAPATIPSTPSDPTAPATPAPYDGAVARLKIPRFNVDSAIQVLGLLPNNQLDVPANPLDTGWYDLPGYGKPGFGANSFFAAHVDYFPDIRGPFYNLAKLDPNDEIVVTMDNGVEYKYRVVRKKRYDVDTIPMGDLIWPPDRPSGKEWVTLITCGGQFVRTQANGAGEYLNRDVVVAERIQ